MEKSEIWNKPMKKMFLYVNIKEVNKITHNLNWDQVGLSFSRFKAIKITYELNDHISQAGKSTKLNILIELGKKTHDWLMIWEDKQFPTGNLSLRTSLQVFFRINKMLEINKICM